MITAEELDRRFSWKPAGAAPQEEVEKQQLLHRKFRELSGEVCRQTAEGREQSLCLTYLQEALFWAAGAVARRE